MVDEGIVPLAHFVDTAGPDALAVTTETDAHGSTHPCAYLRRAGVVEEHVLAPRSWTSAETSTGPSSRDW